MSEDLEGKPTMPTKKSKEVILNFRADQATAELLRSCAALEEKSFSEWIRGLGIRRAKQLEVDPPLAA